MKINVHDTKELFQAVYITSSILSSSTHFSATWLVDAHNAACMDNIDSLIQFTVSMLRQQMRFMQPHLIIDEMILF